MTPQPANDNYPPRGLSWGDRIILATAYICLGLKFYLIWRSLIQ